MITVSMAMSASRDEMEKWFVRAMTADPDCLEACEAKLEAIQPKWGGGETDALAFCTQLYRTGNYYAYLPHAGRYPDTFYGGNMTPDQKAQYASSKFIWPLVRGVYETHLSVYPGDRNAIVGYALAAHEARKWSVAAGQYKIIGDDPPGWVFYYLDRYKQFKTEAETKAKGEEP